MTVVISRTKLEPTSRRTQARRIQKFTLAIRTTLVARTVDVQPLATGKPFRMHQDDRDHRQRRNPVFIGLKQVTRQTNRTILVAQTELGCNNQNISGLGLSDTFHQPRSTISDPQVLLVDRHIIPTKALTRRVDLVERKLHRATVPLSRVLDLRKMFLRQRVHGRNSEPSLSDGRERGQVLGVLKRLGRIKIKDLSDRLDLILDRLRPPVLRRVGVVGLSLLIHELVAYSRCLSTRHARFAQSTLQRVGDRITNQVRKLGSVDLDHPLNLFTRKSGVRQRRNQRVGGHVLQAFDLTRSYDRIFFSFHLNTSNNLEFTARGNVLNPTMRPAPRTKTFYPKR